MDVSDPQKPARTCSGASTSEDLRATLADGLKTNDWLAQENGMMDDYLKRVYPNLDATGAASIQGGHHKKRSESRRDAFVPLTADEKSNVCSNQLDAVMQLLSDVERKGQDEIAEIKTMMEEVDIRMAEARKETHDFKRAVIVAAENPTTGATMADKFVKYMDDKARGKDATIEKLELKNAQLKGQRAKLAKRVAQKEELSDTLHVVDYDQLKIEHQQHLERLDGKNKELLRVKKSTAQSVQALNGLKQELADLAAEQARLDRETRERGHQRDTFATDFAQAQSEAQAAEALVQRLKLEQQDTDQPKILDYLRVKHDNMELAAKKNDTLRKIDIAAMDEKRTARILKTMGAATGAIGRL